MKLGKKRTKSKLKAFLIIGAMIGGITAILASMIKKKREHLQISPCAVSDKNKNYDLKGKEKDKIVLNDETRSQNEMPGSESNCNSPEWERGPET